MPGSTCRAVRSDRVGGDGAGDDVARAADVLAAGRRAAEQGAADRVPYDVWHEQGLLETTPGPTIDYEYVAAFIWDFCQPAQRPQDRVRPLGFEHLKPCWTSAGFSETQLRATIAVRASARARSRCRRRCARSRSCCSTSGCGTAIIRCSTCARQRDGAGRPTTPATANCRRSKSHGRIDGMVALAMAASVAGTWEATPVLDVLTMIG